MSVWVVVECADRVQIIHVPVGIEAVDDSSQHLLCRCARANQRFLIARGGAGGSVLNNFTCVMDVIDDGMSAV